MAYVIDQLITLYPNDNFTVNMDDGNTVSGRPSALIPSPYDSLFQLVGGQGGATFLEAASICRISSINITSASYTTAIQYLPVPAQIPDDCVSQCEASIRTLLPVGTSVQIKVGGQSLGTNPVVASQYGMIVVTRGANLEFVNTCKIDSIRIFQP